VLDVCDHASMTEANAKEAVHTLHREFKYGELDAQLAAAQARAMPYILLRLTLLEAMGDHAPQLLRHLCFVLHLPQVPQHP
jgi:hypothetical protein